MKNYNGETISGIPQLKKAEYGTGKTDRFGWPVVNWNYLSAHADNHGFESDSRYSNAVITSSTYKFLLHGHDSAFCRTISSGMPETNFVSIISGDTALLVIPLPAYSTAMLFIRPSSAYLETVYDSWYPAG